MIKWNSLDWNKNRLDQINNESILNRPFGCGRFRFSFRVSFRTLILNKLWCVFCSCTKPTRDRSWCLTVWYQRTFANSFWICRVYKNRCWIKQSIRSLLNSKIENSPLWNKNLTFCRRFRFEFILMSLILRCSIKDQMCASIRM